jgi:hypothetical protein
MFAALTAGMLNRQPAAGMAVRVLRNGRPKPSPAYEPILGETVTHTYSNRGFATQRQIIDNVSGQPLRAYTAATAVRRRRILITERRRQP